MWAWARLQARAGHAATYYYYFDHKPPFPLRSVQAGWGASHYAELWYVFDHLGQEPWAWTAADRRLADIMASYWVNFIKHGNPNDGHLPHWPAYKGDDDSVQHLGDPVEVGRVANEAHLRVFDAVYAGVRGRPFGTP